MLDALRTATDQGDICLASESINGLLRSMALVGLLSDECLVLAQERLTELAAQSDEPERRLILTMIDYMESVKHEV